MPGNLKKKFRTNEVIHFGLNFRAIVVTAEFMIGPYDAIVLSTVSSASFAKFSIIIFIAAVLCNILW